MLRINDLRIRQIKVCFYLVQVFMPNRAVDVGSRRRKKLRRVKQRTSVDRLGALLWVLGPSDLSTQG